MSSEQAEWRARRNEYLELWKKGSRKGKLRKGAQKRRQAAQAKRIIVVPDERSIERTRRRLAEKGSAVERESSTSKRLGTAEPELTRL